MRATGGKPFPAAAPILSAITPRMKGRRRLACDIYTIPGLAEYEACRARLAADPLTRENYDFAQREKFIRREDRTFVKCVSAPHGPAAAPEGGTP